MSRKINQASPDRPTHWMDDRGYIVADDWLQNDPMSSSDWRNTYRYPCVKKRGKFIPWVAPKPTEPTQGEQA